MTAVEESPKFTGFVKATGHTTTYTASSIQKLNQIQWAELSTYSPETMIANWNEDKYKISSMSKCRPMLSQYDHYYVTTYRGSYGTPSKKVPDVLRFSPGALSKPAWRSIILAKTSS